MEWLPGQVRVHNLQELVYKQGQAGITKASVTIVFNNENRDCSPHGSPRPRETRDCGGNHGPTAVRKY